MIASDDDSESDDSGGLNGEQNSETSDDIIPPDLIDAMDMLRELDQNQHGLVVAGVDPHGAADKSTAISEQENVTTDVGHTGSLVAIWKSTTSKGGSDNVNTTTILIRT
ncbi:hypothetical protein PR001_g4565 [Phytophthora rubi]|uniref:Uncharacterized protein n=1 Tax=Phytophthora rubi TaxID=129364 RepID=A0A6A3NIP1_9STRA|nr:hypothetical protein PR002_g4728 [Phytophthora rubi]KAE9046456.1 hypothetical protein PR001_g4565 [Phytophthora rubi]